MPVKYGLRLNSECRYMDFKKDLSKLCGLDAALMLVCELSNSQIRCVLADEQKLKVSTATELFVYEIPKSDFFRQRSSTEISIENGLKDIQRNKGNKLLLLPYTPYYLNCPVPFDFALFFFVSVFSFSIIDFIQ